MAPKDERWALTHSQACKQVCMQEAKQTQIDAETAQAQAQQRGLASLQPSLVAANVQQLGGAGTAGLGFNQALLDAQPQPAQSAYQEHIDI